MMDVYSLARKATEAMLEQKALTVRHEPGWEREGFPLPIKRNKIPNADGTITQEYRPLAILEYVDEVCSGELASRLAKERYAQAAKEARK